MSRVTPENVQASPHTVALLEVRVRELGLRQRVQELLQARGWPAGDQDLASILVLALAFVHLGQSTHLPTTGRKPLAEQIWFKRPASAEALGGKWPEIVRGKTAAQVVADLDLLALLEP